MYAILTGKIGLFVLLFLIFATGAVFERDCSKSPFEKCHYPKLFGMIPDSVTEFNAVCPELANYVVCLKEFEDLCGNGSKIIFDPEEMYESIYQVFTALCNEGSLINAVVSENLRCLNRTLSNTRCGEDTYDTLNTYKKHTQSAMEDDTQYLSVELHCLRDILNVGCIIEDIAKNCGTLAKSASLEFIRGSHFIEYSCTAKDAKLLQKNIHRYSLGGDQREYLTIVLNNLIEREALLPVIPTFK